MLSRSSPLDDCSSSTSPALSVLSSLSPVASPFTGSDLSAVVVEGYSSSTSFALSVLLCFSPLASPFRGCRLAGIVAPARLEIADSSLSLESAPCPGCCIVAEEAVEASIVVRGGVSVAVLSTDGNVGEAAVEDVTEVSCTVVEVVVASTVSTEVVDVPISELVVTEVVAVVTMDMLLVVATVVVLGVLLGPNTSPATVPSVTGALLDVPNDECCSEVAAMEDEVVSSVWVNSSGRVVDELSVESSEVASLDANEVVETDTKLVVVLVVVET